MEALRTPDARFAALDGFPFEPHYVELTDGLRMHYLDEGPRHAPPVLLLHGQPTWSYLYRHVIPTLVANGLRAVAPDLIGFGRSDKPVARTDYSVRAHHTWLLELVHQLDLTDITLTVQDWGGAIGLSALRQAPERFSRVVATNSTLHTAEPWLAGRLEWACHSSDSGDMVIEPLLLDYQRLTQELAPFIPSVFVQGATTSDLSAAVCAGYDAPFPDETYCAGARQLPLLMGLTPNSACARANRRVLDHLRQSSVPLLTAFSDGDAGTRGWDRILQEVAAGAQGQAHCTLAGAGHFVQEDQGRALAEVIVDFVGTGA
ncbi:MAG TPA: haloalkane dehalogenase [Acidimicrobiales bacterium]|jgi:haloalkane dehalogenase